MKVNEREPEVSRQPIIIARKSIQSKALLFQMDEIIQKPIAAIEITLN